MNASIKYGAAFLVGLALIGTAAQAAPVSSNPTIVSGGITFDNFTIVLTREGTALPGSPAAVDVSALSGATGIQISSGFTAVAPAGPSFSDAAITYVASGTAGLTSVGLSFDGSFLGFAIASVTETIFADAARTILAGQNVVSCSLAGCNLTASIALNGSYDTLYVTKDINVSAFVPGDRAQTSIITQSYGTPTPVPEPMSIALFGMGLAGLGLVRRARNTAK